MKYKILLLASVLFLLSCTNHQIKNNQSDKTGNVNSITQNLNNPHDKTVLVAAHRGDWRNFPENSLEGIESAIKMGIDIVEIDLAMTSDSVLVLMHDRRVDRTTTGKGMVETCTLDSLKSFFLRNGCGVATIYKIPTLKEVLLLCKDRIVINIDKGYKYYDEVDKLLRETGTTKQILIKGSYPAEKVLADFSKHPGDKMMYMPIIDFRKEGASQLFQDYLEIMPAMAYEVVWDQWTLEVEQCMQTILKNNAKIWTNSMWGSLCGGGLYDDLALTDPEKIYGKHILLGATLIQTDRPESLIGYLRTKGLHQ
jgi:glycerophosphoryl diester phosphodiesterase